MALLLLLYLVAEVAAVWAVGSAVGVLGTIGLLILGALVGSWLTRREGAKAANAFLAGARTGRVGEKEVTDGMLVALGGLLIMLPGFVSDLAGLFVLLPPGRAVVRRAWLRRMERTAVRRADRQRGPVLVVDSEIVSEPTPPTPRPGATRPMIIEGEQG